MKIRLVLDDLSLDARLIDNDAARDLFSLLPLTLTFEDFARTEKISYLPRKLTTAGAPPGAVPEVGDITYYAPWGNVAIFYKDHGYAEGLVKLGTIDSGIDSLVGKSEEFAMTIEAAE